MANKYCQLVPGLARGFLILILVSESDSAAATQRLACCMYRTQQTQPAPCTPYFVSLTFPPSAPVPEPRAQLTGQPEVRWLVTLPVIVLPRAITCFALVAPEAFQYQG